MRKYLEQYLELRTSLEEKLEVRMDDLEDIRFYKSLLIFYNPTEFDV